MDEQTATPAETAPDAQTAENVDEQTATPAETAPDAQTAENAPTAETQTIQPPRNEVESSATSLPAPDEPSQQFRMKLHIMRRS